MLLTLQPNFAIISLLKSSPDCLNLMMIQNAGEIIWEYSSAGRASALQAEGHRFEPYCSHQNPECESVRDFYFSLLTFH